jgi:transcriptional regulator with XRE-family HTH domain
MTEIKQLRKQKGFTTTEVANALGISQGYYSQLEAGIRPFDKEQLDKLAAVFRIERSYLQSIAKRIKDDSILSRHWITTIPISGIPAIQAFRRSNVRRKFSSKAQLRKDLIKFLSIHVPDEISIEINSNDELIDLIHKSLNEKQLRHND